MKKQTIYFSIGEKKLKMTVFANNREEAIRKLYSKINIIKVNEEKSDNSIEDFLNGFWKHDKCHS